MSSNETFNEFCHGFGFKNYPFNSFTAENEKEKQADLFVSTKLYSPLFEAFEAGQTMILSGDRGTGKTSITYDFVRHSPADRLICQIDDFSALKEGYSETEFYRFILVAMVNSFFKSIINIKKANKKLSEDEKILLTYFYLNFAGDATRGLANRTARKIQLSPIKRFLRSAYNLFRNPLNIAANFGVGILADIVARSTGTSSSVTSQVSEYFPEIAAGVESEIPKAEDTLEALRRFATLAQKAGFSRIIIILDKIDEDARLENAAEEIADFVEPILTNNKFLLDEQFQVIVSLWVVPLNFLREKVRTQKIHSPEVRWEYHDLQRAYDRRVLVFSHSPSRTFENTFSSEMSTSEKEKILELCNRNPRDLWHLMNRIFRAQFDIDADAKYIKMEAVEKGMAQFVEQFNFYEYYPKKANSRANSMDVYAYIKHLLQLDNHVFTRNMLNEKAGTGSSTQNYTVGMESLGLIEKDVSDKGEISYRIRDPKVKFAIAHGITIAKV